MVCSSGALGSNWCPVWLIDSELGVSFEYLSRGGFTVEKLGYMFELQGHLADKEPPPIAPYSSPMPRDLW